MRIADFPFVRIAMAAAALGCVAAQDAPPTASATDIQNAAATLSKRVESTNAKNEAPPMLSDALDSVAISSAFDRAAIMTLPDDYAVVRKTCVPVMAAGHAYGNYIGAAGADAAAGRAAKIQNELTLAFGAMDACTKRLFATVSADSSATQNVNGGRLETVGSTMQKGAIQIASGMLQAQTDDTVDPANKVKLLTDLADHADALSGGLTLLQRAQLLALVKQVDATDDNRDALDQLTTAFGSTECTGLCSATTVKFNAESGGSR